MAENVEKPKRGPGRPAGSKNKKTLERERMEREKIRQEVESEIVTKMKKSMGTPSDRTIKSVLKKTRGIKLKGHDGTFRAIKACGDYTMLESEQMGQRAYNIILKGERIFADDVDGFRDPRARFAIYGDKALPDSVVKSREMKDHIARVRTDFRQRMAKSHAKVEQSKARVRKADMFEFEGFVHREDDLYDLMHDRIGEEEFDEYLDDVFGTVDIAGGTHDTSYALKQVSPGDYRIMMGEYIDSLVEDAVYELNNASDGEEIYVGPFYITAVEESEDMEKSRRTKSRVGKDTSARNESEARVIRSVYEDLEELLYDLRECRIHARATYLKDKWRDGFGDITVPLLLESAMGKYDEMYENLVDARQEAYRFYEGQMAWSPTAGEEGNWVNKSRKSRARKANTDVRKGVNNMYFEAGDLLSESIESISILGAKLRDISREDFDSTDSASVLADRVDGIENQLVSMKDSEEWMEMRRGVNRWLDYMLNDDMNKSRTSKARKGDDIPQYGMDPMDPPKNPKPKASVSDKGKPDTDPDMPIPTEVPNTDEGRNEKDKAVFEMDDIEKMIKDIRLGKAEGDKTEVQEVNEEAKPDEDEAEVDEAEEYAESDEESKELEEEAEEEMDEPEDIEKMIRDIREGKARTFKEDAYSEPVGNLTQPFANNYRTVVMGQGKNVPIEKPKGQRMKS